MERIAGEELRKPSEWLNQHFLFEFENGTATVRRVCCTPDKWSMDCKDVQKSRTDENSLLLDLFGVEEVAAAAYDKIRLPRTPLIELKEKKLESLASK